MSGNTDSLHEIARFIERHPDALVLTGAGISTASGIPDYRDADGVRRGRAPIQGPEFRTMAAVRQRYWARSMIGWPVMRNARPNPGHAALARLQAHALLGPIITQNVDGLHQRAGSAGVLELHGSIHAVICLACGDRQARAMRMSIRTAWKVSRCRIVRIAAACCSRMSCSLAIVFLVSAPAKRGSGWRMQARCWWSGRR